MEFENAKQKAIKYIGISKKTVYEVNQKLSGLGYNQDIIDEVISYLLNIGYLDDIDYTNSYIKQSIRMHKYSILEITQKVLCINLFCVILIKNHISAKIKEVT